MLVPYILSAYQTPDVGINAVIIRSIIVPGKYTFKFGMMIIILNKQYRKLAENVAIPTPISPNFGIRAKVNPTPIIPEISLIMNSI